MNKKRDGVYINDVIFFIILVALFGLEQVIAFYLSAALVWFSILRCARTYHFLRSKIAIMRGSVLPGSIH